MSLRSALAALTASASLVNLAQAIDTSAFSSCDTITRDVVVVGGGPSGSYAAVRLQDEGKSVVLIERDDHLGGHVNTYLDPETNRPVDYGALSYIELPGVRDFYQRFGVNTTTVNITNALPSVYVDFSTGKVVPNFPRDNFTVQTTALVTYLQLAANYSDLYFPGYTGLAALQTNVPADLLLPFGEFVAKYNLQPALPLMWNFLQAIDDILGSPTLTIMSVFAPAVIQSLAQNTFWVPSSGNNTELWAIIQEYLAYDVFVSSSVVEAERNDDGVALVVNTPIGTRLIKAKKLLFTGAPTVQNMDGFDLDDKETDVFSQWTYSSAYVGILRPDNLTALVTYSNTNPDPSPGVYNYPKAPYIGYIPYTGIGNLYRFEMAGDESFTADQAKQLLQDNWDSMVEAGTLPPGGYELVAFADHNPLSLRVTAEQIKAGFYAQLYSLQNYRSTWYTGATFSNDYTSTVIVFTEGLLSSIVDSL